MQLLVILFKRTLEATLLIPTNEFPLGLHCEHSKSNSAIIILITTKLIYPIPLASLIGVLAKSSIFNEDISIFLTESIAIRSKLNIIIKLIKGMILRAANSCEQIEAL